MTRPEYTTPNLTGAIAAIDEAIDSINHAKRAGETTDAVLSICLSSLTTMRETLTHLEGR